MDYELGYKIGTFLPLVVLFVLGCIGTTKGRKWGVYAFGGFLILGGYLLQHYYPYGKGLWW